MSGLTGRRMPRLLNARAFTKTWRIMRLTALLLFVACLHVSARSYSQTVTLTERNASLQDIFKAIHQQTGYQFFYEDALLDKAGKVTIVVKNAPIDEVLAECLRDLPITFSIVNHTIVVKEKPASPALVTALPPPNDIHGRVTDSLGNPLVGASVTVKGTKRGTQTNEKGEFDLKGIGDNVTLMISFSGFESRQVKFGSQSGLNVVLLRSNSPLDQVQVVAYGTTTPRFSTGDVTTVTSAEIEKQPVDNPLLALEGRVPGLLITQTSGVPGSGISITIQGLNTLSAGTDPFYVVDGVPYPSELLPNLGAIMGNGSGTNNQYTSSGYGNPLSYINPADIESISVLKDADATSIYGSRAANGAIIITTKKGKAGKTNVDINLQQGDGAVTRQLPLLNTTQYLKIRHEAFQNDGKTPGPTDYDINGTWDTTRYTNWEKVFIGNTAHYTDAHASVSGGNANTQFTVGAGYNRESTVFPGDLADQKGSLHFSIDNSSTDKKFNMQLSGSYMLDNNDLIHEDYTRVAIYLPPDAPSLYNSNGLLNWAALNGTSTWENPMSNLANKYSNTTKNLVSNLLLSYELLRGLTVKSTFGYNDLQSNETQIYPLSAVAPELLPTELSAAQYGNNDQNNWIIEPQLTYNRNLAKGMLQAMIGTTFEESKSNSQQLTGVGYSSDLLLPDPSAASTLSSAGTLMSDYRYDALYGRINYNWDRKYIIEVTGRRDGSSRFGAANEFHDFAAVGASWIFSEESFIKQFLPFLSFGKLRGSYGTTGNDQIGDYEFLSLYYSSTVPTAYQGAAGLTPYTLSNPFLEWEITKKLQAGVDLGFLKDRILVTANYNHNRSSNLLTFYQLPEITGNAGITENFPATIQNTGLELTLHTKNVVSRRFSWNTSFNMTLPSNKLVAFPGLATSSYAGVYVIGQTIDLAHEFKYLYVDPETGLYTLESAKGQPTSAPSYSTDRDQIINLDPRFYGGFENTLRYKSVELDFTFQFIKQIGANYFQGKRPGQFNSSASGGTFGNQPTWVLNRWQQPGDHAEVQLYSAFYPSKVSTAYNAASLSTGAWTDASFIRLKNVSLSWVAPDSWLKTSHLKNLRVFIHAQNLLTITRYKGMDPENKTLNSLPPLRVLTLGVQVGI